MFYLFYENIDLYIYLNVFYILYNINISESLIYVNFTSISIGKSSPHWPMIAHLYIIKGLSMLER